MRSKILAQFAVRRRSPQGTQSNASQQLKSQTPAYPLLLLSACLIALVLLPFVGASAKQIWVDTTGTDTVRVNQGTEPDPYKTISHAITQAYADMDTTGARDTVFVQPGIYHDSLRFNRDTLVVKSVSGAKTTVINGDSVRTVVSFTQSPAVTVLDGFTITRGTPYGILVTDIQDGFSSSPEIRNCIVRRNFGSGGIYLTGSFSSIHHNVIDSNVTASGGGISCTNSAPSIWSNTIRANTVSSASGSGGGIGCINSSPLIWNNLIQHNSVAGGAGGGISLTGFLRTLPTTPALIQNNLILNNSSSHAGGVQLDTTQAYFVNNLVYRDTSTNLSASPGAVEVTGSSCLIQNNIIAANTLGYGLKLTPDSCSNVSRTIQNNYLFADNNVAEMSFGNCPIDSITNHLRVDPKFINSDVGDFHLQSTSTLVNAGVALPPGSKTVDFDGFPRETGSLPDIGPYERTTCNLIANFGVPAEVCAGEAVVFHDSSSGSYTLSIWDYDNGVVDTFTNTMPGTPAVSYPVAGLQETVTHTLVCPYDAVVTVTRTITVLAQPHSVFTIESSTGCAPFTVQFSDSSTGGGRTDTWNFGDGDTSSILNPSHTYVSVGTYHVWLRSSNICGRDSVVDTINVLNPPVASIDSSKNRAGTPPLTVQFYGSATFGPTSWTWNFGDHSVDSASQSQNPTHIYRTPGIYDVSLTAGNDSCGLGEIKIERSYAKIYGFELDSAFANRSDRFSKKFKVVADSLYGRYGGKIALRAVITPSEPRRGTAKASLKPDTINVLDTTTVTVTLSKDLPSDTTYRLLVIGKSTVSSQLVDTVIFPFTSNPDTLIQLSINAIDFDSVQLDSVRTKILTITDSSFFGDGMNLRVKSVYANDTHFQVDSVNNSLLVPNGFIDVRITFKPTALGQRLGILTVISDDPATDSFRVSLRAVGINERVPPTVILTTPANNATDVLIGAPITVQLSERILPSSFSASGANRSIIVSDKDGQFDGSSVLVDSTMVKFVPTAKFPPFDTIVVRLKSTIADTAGNSLDSDSDGVGSDSTADDYVFQFVTGPAIYPGDCNNDGVVNEIDILPLGVFYGLTGPVRRFPPDTTNSWGPKQAHVWSDPRLTYADADGNGTIDVGDALVIALNWERTHVAGSATFPPDFDFTPFRDGFVQLKTSLEGMSESENGRRLLQAVDNILGEKSLPRGFALSQNHPNPFNPATRINYDLPEASNVRLTIHNILGQTVKVLVDEYQDAGFRYTIWDGCDQSGRSVSSGVYFYRLDAGRFREVRKMLKIQ